MYYKKQKQLELQKSSIQTIKIMNHFFTILCNTTDVALFYMLYNLQWSEKK